MLHEGKEYVIRTTNKVTGTIYYNCRHFRQGCLAKLISKREHVGARGDHNCENLLPKQVVDVRCEMRQQLQRAALESASEAPSMVWERVRSALTNLHKGSTLNAIPKLQGVNIVKNTRKGMGCDMLHSLDKTEARWLSDSDKRSFVRFNTGFSVKNKERRIVGFGHPDLVLNNPLEKYNRDFGEKFGRGAHPSLLAFMETAKAEALGYVSRIHDIKLGIQTAPRHAEAVVTQVPDDYMNFM
ncbi:hypothetical protein PInf_008154 [Phytophthora infestans]|nr:hypothetical protein PInf_008154 [Phytophthora infestans]